MKHVKMLLFGALAFAVHLAFDAFATHGSTHAAACSPDVPPATGGS